MTPVLTELVTAARDVVRITFVTPVKEGRPRPFGMPRPSGWPRGLRAVGLATAIVFALLALATVFAVPLRQLGELAESTATPTSLPSLTVGLLLVGVLLSMAMVNTAALHASWWLRLSLLVLSGSTIALFEIPAWTSPTLIGLSVLCFLALVVFTYVRARRDHVWWEFVVVTALLLGATMLPWLLVPDAVSWGVDFRPTTLEGALGTLQPLILPAVMVAGSAPAQIVVMGAEATASRPVRGSVFTVGFGLVVVWLVVMTWQAIGTDDSTLSAVGGALAALVIVAATTSLLLWRAGVQAPPQPRHLPEVWGAWLYPLAAAMSAAVVITFPFILARGVATLLHLTDIAAVLDTGLNLFNDNNPGLVIRGVIGVVTLVIAWRLAARTRLAEAVALGAFAVLVLFDLLGLVPPLRFLQDRSTSAMGLIATAVAIVAALVALARRRFTRGTAVGVMTVMLLTVLYPHRNLLSDPLTFALAFSGPVVLVLGLAWRAITEAQVTHSGSRRYPQSTRVLLYLANTLFATTGVAFVTLSRGLGTDADPTPWGSLGDSTLGDPLLLAGLITGLWLVLRPAPASLPPVPDAAPTHVAS